MFTALTASAPASRATRAIAAMSGSTGDSFAMRGSRVRDRHAETMRRTQAASAPNSMPPALVLGQERFSSKAVIPGAPSNRPTTSPYSSTVNPTTLTRTRAWVNRFASQGRCSSRTRSTPGLARPTELSMPPGNSPTRGAGFPDLGSSETALVTNPPRRSRSSTPSSSLPKPAVPAARRRGF